MSSSDRRTKTDPVVVAVAVGFPVGLIAVFLAGCMWALPEDAWKIAAQPLATLTAGVCALLAGAMALLGAHIVSSRARADNAAQLAEQHRATSDQIEQRKDAATVEALWRRFEWVVDHVGTRRPIGLGLAQSTPGSIDEVQASEILVAIRNAAEDLDAQLSTMLDIYMGQQASGIVAEIGLEGDNADA
ncbi:hypothetical protein H7J07_01385 [Mycobacterium koreense]|uniref:Uncharacterized protein n=1 Tax=Mycolicibacillus koreensis TaxID=1069220 RepID=A0A7I7SER1_9MYCO|nr:hypothetical protein [Mycolicibacillus koreensis]MCV7246912.1 hypothetical protein [Mycolicibacillus koreensis]OSC23705.1 hypothetical protein B8W67_19810 [Mycolicibacillus koreensis]BBY55404.1 hypothetical protein MKOR_26550 [Mycolicibacillus koreensis]